MEKKHKSLIFQGVIYVTAGIIVLILKNEVSRYFDFNHLLVSLLSAIMILLGIMSLLFVYLQGGFSKEEVTSSSIDTFQKQLDRLRNDFLLRIEDISVNAINHQKLEDDIQNRIELITEDSLFEKIRINYEDRLIDDNKSRILERELVEVKFRINQETSRTARNANLNLLIGFFTTFMAIFILGYSLWTTPSSSTTSVNEFAYHFLPRFTLSLFIELFSFFFLRIYKKNLEDIKYLNNERTNIDLKLLALKCAMSIKDDDAIRNVINELSKTERNFILKKDESTVEIEKTKVEVNHNNKALETIFSVLNKK